MFKKLYKKVLIWAEHPYAVKFLMGLSFAESSFFPIPPDVMLGPMTMAKPERAWHFAIITTMFSVLGGMFGYLLGYGAYHSLVIPLLEFLGKQESYQTALAWFNIWGVWVILVAAFTPIPYKVFTIGAGAMQMNFFLFVLASVIGRGLRFFMVCGLFKLGNKYLADWIQRWIDVIGWTVLISIILVYYYIFY